MDILKFMKLAVFNFTLKNREVFLNYDGTKSTVSEPNTHEDIELDRY